MGIPRMIPLKGLGFCQYHRRNDCDLGAKSNRSSVVRTQIPANYHPIVIEVQTPDWCSTSDLSGGEILE